MTHAKSNVVHAYGGVHCGMTYKVARDFAISFTKEDVAHGLINLAQVEDGYEFVAWGTDADGGEFAVDSEYVTLEVGRRLLKEGLVSAMVLAGTTEELNDPETYARLYREQFEE